MEGSAIFDETGSYRYLLRREWDGTGEAVGFIMLNPSTADAMTNDPTIRRCIGFARAWGYGSLWVGNLFAYRSRDPKRLLCVPDPIGPENDDYLRQLAGKVQRLVLAWGDRGIYLDRGAKVKRALSARYSLYCLGTTRNLHPRHPLYLKKEVRPILF
jgi:hypothetical protein